MKPLWKVTQALGIAVGLCVLGGAAGAWLVALAWRVFGWTCR